MSQRRSAKKKRNVIQNSKSIPFQALEQRLLLDGAAVSTLADGANDALQSELNLAAAQLTDPRAQTGTSTDHNAHLLEYGNREKAASSNEIIFIDGAVENAVDFLAHINPSAQVYFLDSSKDGIDQITDVLQNHDEVDAVHIISHGDEGQVVLGNTLVNNNNLSQFSRQLGDWSGALTNDADLLFYGCDLAGNPTGESFIESIAAITGADVSASDDTTGDTDQGGDWNLEYTSGVVATDVITAHTYRSILALSDAQLNIVSTGTPSWDADNNPGNDMDGTNAIIRTHDNIVLEVFYSTDSAGATDLHFTSTLPDGLVWDYLPAAAALDPRSMIVDSVTGLPGGDMRSIIAYVPDVTGTFTSSLTFEARALGGQQGTALNGVTFDVNSNENASSITTDAFDFTLSAAANMDIQLLSPSFRGVFPDATGAQQGAVYSYGIGMLGDHPTRSGTDAFKGSAPLENPISFDIDLSAVTPNAAVFDWGASLGTATEYALDGVHRNYERFTDSGGVARTAWSQGNRPGGQVGEHPTSAPWQDDRAVPDSGDWNITGSAGSVHTVEVSGHDTNGPTFPTNYGSGGVIPAGNKWFSSGQMHIWIPIDDIAPGADGVVGTADDGVLQVMPQLTNFDPDDEWGVTNNFGAGTEDPGNNAYTHTVVSSSLGGPVKRLGEYGKWRWVETSSYWYAGDGETSVGHKYESLLTSGRNGGVLSLSGLVWGDKFDNTATKIIPVSQYYGGSTYSTSGWARAYLSGGPSPGWLTEGVDFVVEFASGGVGGAAGGWTDWNSMGDATLADGETSTVWTTDPTDAALGGVADPVTGVRDSITKYRVKLLNDLPPGATVTSMVSMETFGHSSLELTGDNPLGDIIADFNASTADYLLEDPNPANDWRTSEYDPSTNSYYPEGTGGHVYRGDRLHIVQADVSVDKTVVDLGAGNNYLAGSAATIQLDATVTIPGPDNGAPAQDVYVTDELPAGLTVVGGSAQPAPGTTFTAGDGSTVSVQSVEYFDPGTSAWSTTWVYGATGIRWYFGDVPLNTSLPTMTFDVLVPFDAQQGQTWTNTAVASSPSDDSPEEFRNSSAGIVAVQIAAMAAGKNVVTPLVPENTKITYELGVANVSDDKDVPWLDLVDLLPYNADFEGSSINGAYTNIDITGLDAGLTAYVTSAPAATLDAVDGTVDGYHDPGTAAAGDAWFVAEGTGIWNYTLADVQAGVAGAPTPGQITAIRVVSDKAIFPYLDPGESTKFFLELTPNGNVGIPSDFYTNKFTARTDPAGLPLPVAAGAVTAVVVAPDIEIEKEVALDETHVDIDPTNDAHWGQTVSFDDTDKAYFRLKVTNTGTADFLGATVTDSLPAGATFVAGTTAVSAGDFSGFPATWTFDIAAGDTAYLIYQIDVNDEGNYVNTADVEATDAWGETVDDSDNAEANFVTEISAAKQQTNAVRSAVNPDWFEVTYEAEVMNTSIFDLAQITLTEDLVAAFGAGFQGIVTAPAITASSISPGGTSPTLNAAFDGSSDTAVLSADGLLLPTDSVTVTYTVNVDPALLANPANTTNQIEGGGVTGGPGGTPTTDLSDDGADPDSDNPAARGDDGTGNTDNPTPLVLPSIDLTKQIVGSPVPANSGVNGNFDVTYEFVVENTGTVDLDTIAMDEDFLASMGGAFVGIVSGPTVTMTTATDNPDWNFNYDGGVTDPAVFDNMPVTDTFTYGGSQSNTTGRQWYFGDQKIVIDPNQVYDLSVDASHGDGAGGSYDPAGRTYLGFVSFDIDGNVVSTYTYGKFSGATDTTLAAPLNPGDTTITLTNAAGWNNAGAAHQRTIAWYGYTDSTGYTYPDYSYTRNYLASAWAAGGVSGNTITLSSPWAGPALAAGDAVRNAQSGGSYQYVLASAAYIPQTTTTYTNQIGGGFIPNGAGGTAMFRPGTHSISSLVLADWVGGGTGTQVNVDNFQLTAPNTNLLEPGQKVTFEITVEIDPDAAGAIYDGITGDGDNSLDNQANVTAEDPWNDQPVADTSDDPTDPTDADNGDDSDPDDPTALLFPNIELTKAIVGTPVPASSGTFGNMDVTFELSMTNSGNEPLENISLLEDLATQYGGAFQAIVPQGGAPAVVTFSDANDPVEINAGFDGGATDAELIDNTAGVNELAMGQTITIQIVVEVDPDNVAALYTNGMLVNQATVNGTGTTSGVVTDDESDDPNDATNNDNDSDNDPDDPTTWQVPIVDLTKTLVGAPVPASSGTVGNFDVTYDFTITNYGNAPMDTLSLQEDVATQYGSAFIAIVPQAGIPASIQASSASDAPEINASYDGGLAVAEVFDNSGTNTNLIGMGESVTIRLIFEIDPDAAGAIYDANNALVNQATVSGNHNGNTYTDESDDPNESSDIDPNSDNNPDDPNVLLFPNIELTKAIVGTPVPASSGTFGNMDVTFELVMTNSGNEPLDNLSLLEDLATQYGGAFQAIVPQAGAPAVVTFSDATDPVEINSSFDGGATDAELIDNTAGVNELEMGQSIAIQIVVEVDPDNVAALYTNGMLVNQAAVTGTGTTSGVVADDDSDDPNDATNADNDTDNDPDDPTTWQVPIVDLTKTLVGAPVPASSGTVGNFDVTYDFTITNYGNAPMDMLSLQEDVAAQYGSAFIAIVPQAGAPATVQATSATDVPEISASYDGGSSDAEVFDNSGTNTNLIGMGESVTIRLIFEIDPDAAGAIFDANNALVNQATVSGNHNGTTYTDESDDPNESADVDPNSDNNPDDPNVLLFPSIELTKAIVGTPVPASSGTFGNMDVTFELVMTNSGNEPLDNLSLLEDLATQYGGAFQAIVPQGGAPAVVTFSDATDPVEINSSFDGGATDAELIDNTAGVNELEMGQSIAIQIVVEVDPDNVAALYTNGMLVNQASVTGTGTTSGVVADDDSDDPNDTTNADNDTDNDPDDPTTWQVPIVDLTKTLVGAPVPASSGTVGNFDVTYDFTITNYGNAPMDMLSLQEDVAAQYGSAFIAMVSQAGSPASVQASSASDVPEISSSYDGGSSDAEVFDNSGTNTNLIGMGESVTIRFIFEIDPDAPGAIYDASNALVNQATVSGNHNGNTYTDESDDPNESSDIDPNSDNNPDDPNLLLFPNIELTKAIVGTPVPASSGTFGNMDVTFELVMTNSGNEPLDNLSLLEDLATQYGGAFQAIVPQAGAPAVVTFSDATDPVEINSSFDGGATDAELIDNTAGVNELEMGQSIAIQIVVEVDPDNVAALYTNGMLVNQAAVTGTGTTSGVVADDDSDDPNDATNNDNDADNDPDDPTVWQVPIIDLTKTLVGDPVAASSGAQGNFDVTYDFTITNFGNAPMDMLSLQEDVAAQYGSAFIAIVPQAGSPATVQASSASDVPEINASYDGGLADPEVFDNSGANTNLIGMGESVTIRLIFEVDPDAPGAIFDANNALVNQATVSGSYNGNTYTDESDDPNESDDVDPNSDNNPDDPNLLLLPDVSLAKDIVGTPVLLANGNYDVVYQLVVENTGNADLDVSLQDDLSAQFGAALVNAGSLTMITQPASNPVTLDSANWDGDAVVEMVDQSVSNILKSSESFTVQFTVEIDPDAGGTSQMLNNQAEVSGDAVDENGDPLTDSSGNPVVVDDLSDDGTDPTNDNGSGNADDPTPLVLPAIGLAKSAGDAVPNGDNFDVSFTFVYENTGTVDLGALSLTDDIATEFGNAYVGVVPTSLTVQNFAGSGTAPAANAAWEGNTALDMLDGTGQLNVGDSFEVTFVVTIDPDGIDSVSQGLENQGTAGGQAIDPDTGLPDPGLPVTDDSDNGVDPNAENGENDGDGTFGNDPTPIIIADVRAAKETVGMPTLLTNGNYEQIYQVAIENTGTVDLANLTLAEDIATQFGAAYADASGLIMMTGPSDPSSTVTLDSTNWDGGAITEIVDTTIPSLLVVGDSFVFQFIVEIDAAQATGVLENQVTVGGTAVDGSGNPLNDSNGNPITATDDSDDGSDPSTDNSGAPGDHGTTDDPTPVYIPSIGLAKLAGDAVANGDNFDVDFTLVWENTGTIALDNVDILDDIANQFGAQFVQIVPGSLAVQNFAGLGSAPTANAGWETNTTQTLVNSTGALEVDDTFEVVFTVTIDPDATGTSSTGLENQATSNGDGLDENGNPLTDGSGNPITATDESDNGTDPTGENGEDDGDGTFGNDPTPIVIPDISVAKQVFGTPTLLPNGNFSVTYELVTENTGNIDLANLTLVEDLAAHFGTAMVSAGNITLVTAPADPTSNVVLDSTWDGNGANEMIDQLAATMLAVGDSFTVHFDVEVDPDAVGAPGQLDNQVTVGGDGVDENGNPVTDSSGNPITVTDDSDSGTDPNTTNAGADGDSGGSDDPTPLIIPAVGLAKSAGDAVANGDNFDVAFTFVYENTGTVDLATLSLTDDIATEFGNAFVTVVPGSLAVQNFVGSGTAPAANAAWESDTTLDMLDGTGQANIGDTFEVTFVVTIDPDGIDSVSQGLENQGTAGGVGINPDTGAPDPALTTTDDSDNGVDPGAENGEDDGDNTFGNDPTPVIIADVRAAKETVGLPTLQSNGNYNQTYQVVIENTGTVDLANLTLSEDIATQFGAAYANASGLNMITGPADPSSIVTLDSANWNGGSATEIVDITAPSLLAVGDSFIFEFIVEIDAAQASGVLENQVTVTGAAVDEDGNPLNDSNGNPITATDDSDDGSDPSTDNNGAPGDHGTTDDPTPVYIPSIGLAKTVGDPTPNGDNFDVTFTLVWENTGTVALDNIDLLDDITAQFGPQFVAIIPGSLAVQNFVGAGSAPTANAAWETDTTQTLVNSTGALEVDDTFEVVFTVTIDPDATGSSGGLLENQATSTGAGLDEDGNLLTDGGGNPITVTDESDNGTDPAGENGQDDGDGVYGNNPTPVIIADISIAKQVFGTPILLPNGNFEVVYELVTENTGYLDLASLTQVEDLATHFGSALVSAGNITLVTPPADPSSNIVLDSTWDGNGATEMIDQTASTMLAIGDSYTVQFTVEVDPDAVGAPGQLDNQVTVGGDAVDQNGNVMTDSSGNPIGVTDDSDSGTDPNTTNSGADGDTGGSDDPTPLLLPSIGLAKTAGDAVANGDNFDVPFTFIYENTGSVDLTTLTLNDDIAAQFGNAFVGIVPASLAVQNFAGSGTAPGANAAWEGDTTLDMLDGTGQVNIGDSFEVTFIVTIDPDGIDSVSQGLENQGTATGQGINPDTGLPEPGLTVTDDSDNGVDPHSDNGEDDGDNVFGNDPTPIIIADVGAAKETVGTPILLGNGNYAQTYQVVIENIGTVDLANLTLAEDIATQFGTAYVNANGLTMITGPADPTSAISFDTANWNGGSSTEIIDTTTPSLLAVGDSFTFQFVVEIDAAQATGVLENQVTVGGDAVDDNGNPLTDGSGAPITATDDSDDGTEPSDNNSNAPGDHGSTDDPTPVYIPSIGLAKLAGDAVPNGDNFDVDFTLVWENTGTVALDNVDIVDDIATQFGVQFVSIVPGSLAVQNFAGSGSAPTANAGWETNTTQTLVNSTGALEVDDTFEVVFTVTIDPDVTGTSSTGLENQATSTGEGLDENGNPLTDGSGNPITATDDSDNGSDPAGENGEDDGDGTFGNDPTPIVIPDISVVKQVAGTPALLSNGNFAVTYELVTENTGNIDLANLTLVEDLAAHFGTAMVSAGNITLTVPPADPSSNVVVDSTWDGNGANEMIDQVAATMLAVGDSFTVQFIVEVDPDAVGAPGQLDNQVTVGGDGVDENGNPVTDSSGNPITVTDDSDSGTDPNTTNAGADGDSGGSDDPTPLLLPAVGLAKSAGDAVANGDNFDVAFTFVYENTGTVDLATLSLTDDIATEFGNAFVSIVPASLTVQNFVGTGTAPGANTAWEGNTTLDMLDGTGQANIGDTFEVTFIVTIDPDGIDSVSQGLENQGTAGGVGIHPDTGAPDPALTTTDDSDNGVDPGAENGEDDGDNTFGNDPTPVIIADVAVAKQAYGTPVQLSNGNFEVVYELLIENTGTVDLGDMSLVEDLATQYGAVYVDAHTLTMITPPVDASSNIVLDNGWNGGGATEMIDQAATTSLVVGDSFLVHFTVEIDATAASGPLTNQVTAAGTAVDDNGNPITDSTGNPITATDDSDSGGEPSDNNSGEPGDNGTTDDPTPLYLANVGLAKAAGMPVANGDNWDVPFTLVFENNGALDLHNLTMMDDIMAEFGNAFVSANGLAVQNFTGAGTAPVANTAWETDTTQSMITGGLAVVDDTFEVVFKVTIDPDGVDDVSQSLNNQATTTGDALDENGNPLIDDNGNPITATDDSDDGADPVGENGDSNGDGTFGNDPTPILIADIAASKEVFGAPVAQPDGTFEVVYQVVIENTGTVDLAGLTLTEDMLTHYGAPFVSASSLVMTTQPADASSTVTLDTNWDGSTMTEMVDQSAASLLAVGDFFTIQFNVIVDPDAGGTSGPLNNQVVVGGNAVDGQGNPITDPSGNPVSATDDSDDGNNPNTNNSNYQGDANTSDDPTPLLLPDVGVAKVAGVPVANGDNWDVEFTLVMENTGTVSLDNLTMFDDVMTEFGNAFVSASDVTIGSLNGSGTLPAANTSWATDTSASMLIGGSLDVGSSFDLTFTVTLDPDGVDSVSQGLNNQAVGGGDGVNPDGTPMIDANGNPVTVSDDSDSGTDANAENDDATPILIADLSLAKSVLGDSILLPNGNYDVTYQLVVENTGTVDLAGLSLTEDLATQFGAGLIDAGGLTMAAAPTAANSVIALNSSFNGSSNPELMDTASASLLAIGDSFTLEFTVEINAIRLPSMNATNSVSGSAGGVDENGDPIIDPNGNPLNTNDDSDSGSDPSSDNSGEPGDTSGSDDPTPLPFFEPVLPIGAALADSPLLNLGDSNQTIVESNDYQRDTYRPFAQAKLVILNMVESLKSLSGLDDLNMNDPELEHLYLDYQESEGFSSGKGYRGTHSVDPTDECGRFFIDTIVDDNMLSITSRSTIDPQRSIGVVGYSATLANGQPLPDWVSVVADGEYRLDRSVGIETVALKIIAHREGAEDLVRLVEIDTLTGQIRNQQQATTFGAGFYQVLEASAVDEGADDAETEAENIDATAE